MTYNLWREYYKEEWKFIKDLTENDYIYTELGWSKVKSVVNTHKL